MKYFLTVGLVIVSTCIFGCAGIPKYDFYPETKAEEWLRLLDGGKIAQAWEELAPQFKKGKTYYVFNSYVQSVRSSMGRFTARKFWRRSYRTTVRGQPDGEYFIVLFQTFFENKTSGAFEHVLLVKLSGEWKITGYILR